MCNKRGITPQYDLIANEGAVHEPLFVFKVAAGEYIGTGKGLAFFRSLISGIVEWVRDPYVQSA